MTFVSYNLIEKLNQSLAIIASQIKKRKKKHTKSTNQQNDVKVITSRVC